MSILYAISIVYIAGEYCDPPFCTPIGSSKNKSSSSFHQGAKQQNRYQAAQVYYSKIIYLYSRRGGKGRYIEILTDT